MFCDKYLNTLKIRTKFTTECSVGTWCNFKIYNSNLSYRKNLKKLKFVIYNFKKIQRLLIKKIIKKQKLKSHKKRYYKGLLLRDYELKVKFC